MSYKYKEFDFSKDIKKNISYNIKKYRILKGYTQEELALYTDRSFEFIRRIESEKGKRGCSIETLYRISVVLDISVDDLFADTKEKVAN